MGSDQVEELEGREHPLDGFRQGSEGAGFVCGNLTAVWRLDLWEVRLAVGDQLGGSLPADGMHVGTRATHSRGAGWRDVRCERQTRCGDEGDRGGGGA